MRTGKILTPKKDKYKKGSVYNYVKRRIAIVEYEAETGVICLEDICPEWADEFILFLMEQKQYCKNTIATHIAGVKAVLNILYKKGISEYNGTGIGTSKELTTAVFSSIEDLQVLLNTDFGDREALSRVRYVYVMHCFLGLRFSDLRKFLRDPKTYLRHHGNSQFVELKTQKNGEVVVIPIADVVKQILDIFGYDFNGLFTYQHYNKSIREMAEIAGLTNKIECTRTKAGVRQDYIMRKCDMMSSHTARRTFATNAMLSKDFNMTAIMKITGHRTVNSFERYVRCNVLESAINVAGNAFFKIPLVVNPVLLNDNDLIKIEGA
ncbi:phage integrase SAM-like domain-containing protein [Chitinophagaceae bacterium LY-5]|uniref:Phage integrase SAM-like domain-containing protein n=2 Tax=Polluticaenibacter yanchengensis TaxID=3014562 RepID=A0ABT4UIZ8_9BACT|nr:phage integrase SAM-like domain-containing protein [Chitinophagaceae bacterium LY-5]